MSTLLVAGALSIAAALVLARGLQFDIGLPRQWVAVGCWGVTVAFGLRSIGEFRYVGIFRRVRGTAFARWDELLFTPLCLVIAGATAVIATGAP